MALNTYAILTAHNEADRLQATISALRQAFPQTSIWVADDGSIDATPQIAEALADELIRSQRPVGKGGAATLAARAILERFQPQERDVVLLCDADLGESALLLEDLVRAVDAQEYDLAVARFARRVGGGVGIAVGFAAYAIHRRCGLRTQAPISGQRAVSVKALKDVLPFADGFGMEIGMTIDAVRGGYRVGEIELDLTHRATGRTLSGFLHRGRQLADFVRVYFARR